MRPVDVLIPTADRPQALAPTLAALLGQTYPDFRVLVSDQGDTAALDAAPVAAAVAALAAHGVPVEVERHLPRRGIAENRDRLLHRSQAPLVLYLDDDVLLGPAVLTRLERALRELSAAFVGSAMQGLSYAGDVRPAEHATFQPWDGPVRPERIRKDTPAWERWRLHNAANLTHLALDLDLTAADGDGDYLAYRVCWVAGCVLYDRAHLLDVGGFGFWRDLPPDVRGEEVAVQIRLLERVGGAGVLPSQAYHLELPTSLGERGTDAYAAVIEAGDAAAAS